MSSLTAFFNAASAVSTNDINKYYLIYHKTGGFQLEKKHVTHIPFVDALIRLVKGWMGYSYQFADTTKRFVTAVKKDFNNIQDVNAFLLTCARMRALGEHVFARKYHDSSELEESIGQLINRLLGKKAKEENVSVLEYACRCDLFKEAEKYVTPSEQFRSLSQESKNKLLGYYLQKYDLDRSQRLLAAGADPNSQIELMRGMLNQLPSECLKEFFIVSDARGKLRFIKEADVTDIVADVLSCTYKNALQHNINKVSTVIAFSPHLVADVKGCIEAIRKLQASNRWVKSSSFDIACSSLLMLKATELGVSALELAVSLFLDTDVYYLVDQGADIFTLSPESAPRLLHYLLYRNKNPEQVRQLITLGVDVSHLVDHLQPTLHQSIKEGDVEVATKLIQAGVSLKPTKKGRDDSALFLAAQHGSIAIIEALLAKNVSLSERFSHGKTVLHVAARNQHYDLVNWLAKRMDVTARDDYDHTAFFDDGDDDHEEFFADKPQLECSFLKGDVKACRKELEWLSADDAVDAVATLRGKYPLSCVEHMLYSVNSSHYSGQKVVALPEDVAKGYKCKQLLDLYNQVNFTDANAPHYVDPSQFGDVSLDELKAALKQLIENVDKKIAFLGTPKPGPSLDLFYFAMKRAITHTIKLFSEMPESDQKTSLRNKVIVQYLHAAFYCGGKQYATSCQQYVAVSTGKEATFEDEVLEMLASYRETLFQSLIPQGNQSVHDFNKMMQHLGVELGIPGAEMMQNFEDHYGKHVIKYKEIKEKFLALYNPQNIIFECIKQTLEQTAELRNKFLDWSKSHVPAAWKASYFAKIEQELETKETDEEKRAYLESQEISCDKDKTIDELLEEARLDEDSIAYRYLGLEVVVDMANPKMQFKPAAIGHLLSELKVITPVYDWSYFSVGALTLAKGWNRIKSVLRGALSLLR